MFWQILNYETHECLNNIIHVLLLLILGGEEKGGFQMGKNRAINEERKRRGWREEGRNEKKESLSKELSCYEAWVFHLALKLGQCLRITGFSFRLEIIKEEVGLPQKETARKKPKRIEKCVRCPKG